MSEIKVKGLAELNAFLQQLPAKLEANVLRGALRAGAVVIRDEAKAHAAVHTGALRDGIKVSTRSRRGRVTASVKAGGPHGYLAHWLEFGTKPHRIVAKGKGLFFGGLFAHAVDHPGTSPRPFMRPALDSRATAAVVAAAEHMKRRLATKHGLDTADVEITPD